MKITKQIQLIKQIYKLIPLFKYSLSPITKLISLLGFTLNPFEIANLAKIKQVSSHHQAW